MNEAISGVIDPVRAGCFLAVLIVLLTWEAASPRRANNVSKLVRWPSNLGISVLNRVLIQLIFPFLGLSTAYVVESSGWGLFNQLSLPFWIVIILSTILLDLVIYLQHRVFHTIPWLWRLHRMHHADTNLDATSGIRFHPLEAMVSMAIKLLAISLFGVPLFAVLVFEILLNATSLFNHANINIPTRIDRFLRCFIVTPDMHRVHHSVDNQELNTNFGFNLPWWDHLFHTYKSQPKDGHDKMTIGLNYFRADADNRLDKILLQPFKKVPD